MRLSLFYEAASTDNSAPKRSPVLPTGATAGMKPMNVIEKLEAEHAAKLPGAKIPEFQAGDTVVVNVKVAEGERTRVQAYEGVCIARSGGGLNESFTVRKISYGEGVERVFPVYSPMIDSVKVLAPGQGSPRQALLSQRPSRQVGPHRRAHGQHSQGCGQGTRRQIGHSCPPERGRSIWK